MFSNNLKRKYNLVKIKDYIRKFAPLNITSNNMKLSQFKFNLPDSLVANNPSEQRDEARLMVLHKDTGKIEHKIFKDILGYFDDKDVMILNKHQSFSCPFIREIKKNRRHNWSVLLREMNKKLRLWDVLVDPARKIRVGNKLYFWWWRSFGS